LLLFPRNRDFGTDTLLIRTKIMVGARSAQWQFTEIGRRRKYLDL